MLTAMAKALLKMEILKELDWTGDLVESMSSGLMRWANEELGCGSLAHFTHYEISYTDDHLSFSIDTDRFCESLPKEAEHALPLCGLGIIAPHYKSLD